MQMRLLSNMWNVLPCLVKDDVASGLVLMVGQFGATYGGIGTYR
jgi:hypothetical protein